MARSLFSALLIACIVQTSSDIYAVSPLNKSSQDGRSKAAPVRCFTCPINHSQRRQLPGGVAWMDLSKLTDSFVQQQWASGSVQLCWEMDHETCTGCGVILFEDGVPEVRAETGPL